MSDFEKALRQRITIEGPLTLECYMSLCLEHYYATRDPLGAEGDFTTAPEISQMFGELVGLWAVEVWSLMGRPDPCHLIELGPGRGTLMADALRAARILPAFQRAIRVHLVETSPVLKERQQAALKSFAAEITWHDRLEDVSSGPALIIANEFFDALPVRQFAATERGWCERLVGIENDALVFGLRAEPEPIPQAKGRLGAVLEWPEASLALAQQIGQRLARHGGAALVIDYGYEGPAAQDTLQALHRHRPVSPLDKPGEADLTTHVDFTHLARAAIQEGARAHGPVSQASFLESLGIQARASALKGNATARQNEDIDQALFRLTDRDPKGMGELFKVLALSHKDLEALPGLPARQHP